MTCAEMVYENLDLLFVPSDQGHLVKIIASPVGQASARFTLPFPEQDIPELGSLQPEAVRELGKTLFDAIFHDETLTCLRRSLDEARRRRAGLRIRLNLTDVPGLAALPWEYVYDSDAGSFVALSTETPLIRYLDLPQIVPSLAVEPPLRMLMVASSPDDYPPLDTEREWKALNEALEPLLRQGRAELVPLNGAALPALQEKLGQDEYHILHFVVHGVLDQHSQDSTLILQDGQGQAHPVGRERLGGILRDHRSLRLAFINACQGALSARSDPFAGMAQSLVRQGIPVVVAMQSSVTDEKAIGMVHGFYSALAGGCPIDASLTEARKAALALGDTVEWGMPVLFSRQRDNQILASPSGETMPTLERKPFEPDTVYVPKGPFLMGSLAGDGIPDNETPQHTVVLPAYCIGRYPVTNAQYAVFLEHDKNQDAPHRVGWFLREPPSDKLDHPVVGVSWHDAQAYCRWLHKETGRHYRLPTEAEWEKAARGTEGQRYPWGSEWEEQRCNCDGAGTTSVTAHPQGASPYGCCDMAGNVEEWVSTRWGNDHKKSDFPYPYRAGDGREDPATDRYAHRVYCVYRSSAFGDERSRLRCSARACALAQSKTKERGFRVVLQISNEESAT